MFAFVGKYVWLKRKSRGLDKCGVEYECWI